MPNKELDEMREWIAERLFNWYCGYADIQEGKWQKEYTVFKGTFYKRADQILSLETDTCRIAVVKRKAELPKITPAFLDKLLATAGSKYGYTALEAMPLEEKIEAILTVFVKDMLAKHFVEEVVDG